MVAPSGRAVYNIQECTLYQLLALLVNNTALVWCLNNEKQAELGDELKIIIMLIIDERSIINVSLFGAVERNVRQRIYGEQNIEELLSRLPVILLFWRATISSLLLRRLEQSKDM